jgi:HK97 family phage prohead protease
MKTSTDEPDVKTREIGEKVKLNLSFEPTLTKDLGNGSVECVVTTSAVDRYNESIDTAGIDTTHFMNNPVVLYGHDYSGLPIGKTTKITQMKNKMKAQFQLAVDEYPFAATVYAMIKGGYLNAVSIGGRVKEWSEDYKTILQMEMVEFSVVAVPANPDAMITGKDFEAIVGKSFEEVGRELEDFSQKIMLDKFKTMPEDDVIDAIKVLKILLDRLEETAQPSSLTDDKPQKRTKHYVLKDAAAVQAQSQKIIKIIKFS